MKIKTFFFALCLFILGKATAQKDLLASLLEEQDSAFYTAAVFKTTRIAIGHSIETRKRGTTQLSLMTRYWDTPSPKSNSFVADKMTARLGVDYAFSDRFTAGGGMATLDGIADVFLKYRLLRQKSNGKPWLGVTLVQTTSYRTKNFNNLNQTENFLDKLSFTSQVLLGKKLTRNFSLQVAPTYIHRVSSQSPADDSNHFAVGFGGRYKLSNHLSLVSEYYWIANELASRNTFGAFVVGTNWELGDIILQFKLTNARNFAEDTFITQTPVNFNTRRGNLSFGFHVNYIIH
ncbi:MAG: DUF5777 family beta-barrel protein [Bacteroidota bacterium]